MGCAHEHADQGDNFCGQCGMPLTDEGRRLVPELIHREAEALGLPPVPIDVRAVYPDGSEIPVELFYVGLVGNDVHEWTSVRPVRPGYERVTCAELPPKTAINIEIEEQF